MITFRRSAPSPTITCFSRSCVRGRANFIPASSIAIALASAGPIQIGNTRSPFCSCKITTGVLVVLSRPRWATRTSITSGRPSGPLIPGGEVALLLGGEGVDPHTHRRQLEPRDVPVELRRNAVHVLPERRRLAHYVFRGEGLVGERHVHDARGMSLRRRQVHQPPFGQHEDALAAEPPLLDELAHPRGALRFLRQSIEVQ